MVVLPWHNFVMVELLTFFLLSFRSSSIFFVPAQLWRHDRSTECPLEGKHWAACSCTNMILMFLLSAAALHGPHTALPGGSAVAQLCDGRAAHFLSFELSKLIHRPCASPIVAPRSLYRVPTGRKTLGSLQLHKHIYIYIHVPLHQMILPFYQMYLLLFLVNQNMVRIQMCVSLLPRKSWKLVTANRNPWKDVPAYW